MGGAEHNCDVLVVGAGPAGLRAAVEAARTGARTLVVDENGAAGGQIWRGGAVLQREHDGPAARHALRALKGFERSNARLLSWTRVVDAPAPGKLTALRQEGGTEELVQLRYDALVLATGARERFLPFPGWTLPGVFGAGGLQALAKSGLPVRGLRVVVAGSGPLLLAVAAHLHKHGAELAGVYEQAPLRRLLPFALKLTCDVGRLLQGAGYAWRIRRTPLRTGCWPVAALGESRLEAVRMTDGRRSWTVPCDALACGFHLVPNTELAQLLGCVLTADGAVAVDATGRTSREAVFCAGEPTGIGGLELAEAEGTLAGAHAAAYALGRDVALTSERHARLVAEAAALRVFGRALNAAFAPRPELRALPEADTIVCRCEDVSFGMLQTHRGWREAKLQTRCGMGACQGRICGPAVQTLLGWQPASVRPPLTPVPLAILAVGDDMLPNEKEFS